MINSKNNTNHIPTYLNVIFVTALIFIVGIFLSYFLHFGINGNFVIDQKNILNPQEIWAWFGDYVGGLSSSILAFLALIALLLSIYHQINQFEKSTAVLNEQNQLLKDQIQEARNLKFSEDEIKKIDATNDFLIEAIIALKELLAIKNNYYMKFNNHPVDRASIMPPILTSFRSSNFHIPKLIFLEKRVTQPRGKFAGDIIYLSAVLDNFNTIMEMLKVRNDLHVDIAQNPSVDVAATLEFPQGDQQTLVFFNKTGIIRGIKLIHLTEELINYIDRTLIDLYKIIKELPDIAESLITPGVAQEFSKVLRYNLNAKQEDVFRYNVPIDRELYSLFINKQYL